MTEDWKMLVEEKGLRLCGDHLGHALRFLLSLTVTVG